MRAKKRSGKTAIVHGHRVHLSGPFKGSDKNGGREIYTWYDPKTGKRGSVDAARVDYENAHGGKELSKGTDVDHKDNDKEHGSVSNLQPMSHSDNVAKENRHRAHEHKHKKK